MQVRVRPGLAKVPRVSASGLAVVRSLTAWYFDEVFERFEGPSIVPFYCDPSRVGLFAVDSRDLALGGPASLFRLFIAMAMFQSQPDVRIMRRQSSMAARQVATLTSPSTLGRRIAGNDCSFLRSPLSFDRGCDVHKLHEHVDCGQNPGRPCHVKTATELLRRTGDMGKLSTSAWFHLWPALRGDTLVHRAAEESPDPQVRANIVVRELQQVHRVGRKLSTMYVSALALPALSATTPWFPRIDGDSLVVVDTNVASAIAHLDGGHASTYEQRVRWVTRVAEHIDLQPLASGVKSFSPRMVQQALYSFCSRSNRLARGDKCRSRCPAPGLCPICSRGAPAPGPRAQRRPFGPPS
jgi:hypothetical protein